jgi:hypothetical protein
MTCAGFEGLPDPPEGCRCELRHVTCKRCKIAMKELKGHLYHKQRKWRCPRCGKIRMQAPREIQR